MKGLKMLKDIKKRKKPAVLSVLLLIIFIIPVYAAAPAGASLQAGVGASVEDNTAAPEGETAGLEGDKTAVEGETAAPEGDTAVRKSAPGLPDGDEMPPELKELDGKRFGVPSGSTFDKDIMNWFPNAQLKYYNAVPDMAVALATGKIDAFPVEEITLEMMKQENASIMDGLTVVNYFMDSYDFGFVFSKTAEGGHLRDQMDEWMTRARESGALDAMQEKWFHAEEKDKTMPEYASLPSDHGVLTFVTEAGFPPFDYMRSGEVVGFEVEMAIEFCKEYGYGIDIVPMNSDGILPAIQGGRADFAASGIMISEERKESLNFSQPYYRAGTKIVIRNSKEGGDRSFLSGIKESLEKTFIREDRWKMFVEGSVNTMLITIFSVLFGTILGFLMYMFCRSRGILVNTMTAWFTWFLQGMPTVVLLMTLYYVVFGNTSVNGIIISIVAFTLLFGVSVLGILQNAVEAVDKGQTEAAGAIGCTPRMIFFRIVFPQAIPFMTGPYKGEVIGLIKATSIVGYIAVLDLAKMGDLVRSRTYEAFFPLIAVMVIYFVLEGICGVTLRFIENRVDPKKRKNRPLLKGVDLHDKA